MNQLNYYCLIGIIFFQSSAVLSQSLPNIVWILAEDLSPRIGAYGDPVAKTPNIDQLAMEGVLYTNLHSVSGVCAPSRSALVSGMFPTSIGTHNMRTRDYKYHAVPPPNVKGFTEYLRAGGYYCINFDKMDYQWGEPMTMWDESSRQIDWNKRMDGQPFFALINIFVTHESQIWYRQTNSTVAAPEQVHLPPYAPKTPVARWEFQRSYLGERKLDQSYTDPKAVPLPPYYPDAPLIRKDIARHYDNIALCDQQVGAIMEALENDGLLENTIIIFFGDHGDGLPRMKREIYDSGLRTPLIIRYPDRRAAGTVNDQLLSFIDMAPTTLSLAGIQPPEHMHGKAFAGTYRSTEKNQYIYAARDRMDFHLDTRRAVKDKQYKYIKNYYPDRPYIGNIDYRRNMDLMNELIRLHEAGQLNKEQALWFRQSKPVEELYDLLEDPHELNNLADKPEHQQTLQRLRQAHENWQKKYGDLGLIPESQLIEQMWPDGIQPLTAAPVIKIKSIGNKKFRVSISCPTKGASIAWTAQKGTASSQGWPHWQLYTEPLIMEAPESGIIRAKAIRYGYQHSQETAVVLPKD